MEPVRLGQAVLAELKAAMGTEVRATHMASILRSRGIASLPPQTLRHVLGGLVPDLAERTWNVTTELLEALEAACRPAGAADQGRPTHETATSGEGIPAGLPLAIRVALRSSDLTVPEIVEQLVHRGWARITPETVTESLHRFPTAFVETSAGWRVTANADSVQFAAPVPEVRHSADPGLPGLPAEAELSLWLVAAEEELASLKLPPEPEMRELFLHIYAKTKLAQVRADLRDGAIQGVWIAGRGELYHYSRECSRIWGGRAAAVERGQGNSWVKQVTEHEAQRLQRDPCPQCTSGSGSTRRR